MSVAPATPRQGPIQSAIALASARTGIDFNYLLGQAQVESGLRADARAGTSSARGLYQFIEQSWLSVVKKHGAEHGLGWAADSISQSTHGRLSVRDASMRQAILALRNDPSAASLMAAEHAADNKAGIEAELGRAATGTDLYMAHFLGLGGAKRFLKAMAANPDRAGAALFPSAARANHGVFYGAGGRPRSLSEIYARFSAKLDDGAGKAGGATPDLPSPLDPAALALGDNEVVPGAEDAGSAIAWARVALGRGEANNAARVAAPIKPSPETARLAYMMLASLGGN